MVRVDARTYAGAADTLLYYMRQQRSGYNPTLRDSVHKRDGIIVDHPTRSGEFIPVSGGWADAADYLQYVTTSATATYVMLKARLDFPRAFADGFDANGLPGPNGTDDALDEARHGLEWLLRMIRSRGRIAFVALSDIEWIETSRNYARVRAKGVWHSVREPLTSFANRLDPLQFVRVSRSRIVNLDRVREFRRQANGQYLVLLDDGQRLMPDSNAAVGADGAIETLPRVEMGKRRVAREALQQFEGAPVLEQRGSAPVEKGFGVQETQLAM